MKMSTLQLPATLVLSGLLLSACSLFEGPAPASEKKTMTVSVVDSGGDPAVVTLTDETGDLERENTAAPAEKPAAKPASSVKTYWAPAPAKSEAKPAAVAAPAPKPDIPAETASAPAAAPETVTAVESVSTPDQAPAEPAESGSSSRPNFFLAFLIVGLTGLALVAQPLYRKFIKVS